MQAIPRQSSHVSIRSVPVAIYTRVSTLHQVGGRFDSCESQAAICREYIRKHAHEGWYEVACHTDAAYSGGSMNRPGIQALKRQLAAGEVKVVLIFKLERVLRSTDEWGPFRAFLQQHGCRLVSTTEDLSEETPSGRLKNNLLVSVAEYERLNTAEKVRAKLAELTKRGIWNCGLVPYGFNYDSEAKTLHVHPQEAPVVRRIFEEAAMLVSLTTIANALNEEGRRTRDRVFKRRDQSLVNVGGKRFRSDSLRRIVQNPIYSGRLRFHGEEFPGNHEALVSRELWEQANAAIAQTLQPARCFLQARDKNFHLLKGLAYCAHCGQAMIPTASGKRDLDGKLYRYYTCCHAHKERADSFCRVRSVPAGLLESAVVQFIGAIGRHPELVQGALETARTGKKVDRAQLRERHRIIDGSLQQTQQRLQNFLAVIAAGGADALGDELQGKASALKEEKQRLLVERETIRQQLLACEQPKFDAERILHALGRFEAMFPCLSQAEQKELVALCFNRVEIRDRPPVGGQPRGLQTLELRLGIPVARLVEGMEERVIVRRRADSPSPLAQRPITLVIRVALWARRQPPTATILAPFHEEVMLPASETPGPNPEEKLLHPLERAREWQRQLSRNPRLTQAMLARKTGVTAATITYHLRLLDLVPEIQEFLTGLKSKKSLRRFSLRRMKALATLDHAAQRKAFAAMQGTVSSR
jgi:DNA invertase Pin-like site-specific DNA recombinase